MKFEARRLVIGTKPKVDWVGQNATMLITFSACENHNVNVGTKDDPEWETKSVSWFNMEAWADIAKDMLDDELSVGDIISASGSHKIDKVQTENEKPRYYSKYTIRDYEKYEKNKE